MEWTNTSDKTTSIAQLDINTPIENIAYTPKERKKYQDKGYSIKCEKRRVKFKD